jgi:hypothetical protein
MSPGSGGQRKTGAQTVTVRTASGQELAYPWATSVRVDRQGDLRVLMVLTLSGTRICAMTRSLPRFGFPPTMAD